ncbi:hypothetical protein [Flavobacterium sharifuzzamanii]|uniref:hypothetical protein n=1 Tax=Flavobacterium sharifuzzamanii TaxID=2211133 RepID=UPI000DACEA69|nr:hypothetical protein [Flavobacterium sharifuzzamanii]KAF2080215.1 hypothetical protein DMA14_12995 [Flavobacterium sharifuzzamanii]
MNQFITSLEQKNIFTERLMFVRLLLAISALLTIVFNNIEYITNFDLVLNDETKFAAIIFFKQFSIFTLFHPILAKVVSILILLIITTGYFPQLTCFLHAWVHLSICNSFLGVDGGDQIASNLSILLVPICLFDNRINQWKTGKNITTKPRKAINVFFNTYYFLILLQVAVIYLHAGIGKLYNNEWRDGTCAYYWFTNNIFGAPFFLQKLYSIITLSSFTPIITWSVIILELGLFACILASNINLKKTFLIIGLLFHFSILITHGLISFFFSMASALILYLDNENMIFVFSKTKFISLKNVLQSKTIQQRKKQLT